VGLVAGCAGFATQFWRLLVQQARIARGEGFAELPRLGEGGSCLAGIVAGAVRIAEGSQGVGLDAGAPAGGAPDGAGDLDGEPGQERAP